MEDLLVNSNQTETVGFIAHFHPKVGVLPELSLKYTLRRETAYKRPLLASLVVPGQQNAR